MELKAYSFQEIELYSGQYDEEMNYILPDGSYFDQNGYFYDKDGYDENGGYFDFEKKEYINYQNDFEEGKKIDYLEDEGYEMIQFATNKNSKGGGKKVQFQLK